MRFKHFLKNFFVTYLEIIRKLEKSKVSFIGICQSGGKTTPIVTANRIN